MELFVTIFDRFHSITVVTKIFILDVAGVLDSALITDISASRSWMLISLKPIVPLYRNRSINPNGKEDDWLEI